MCDQRCSQLMSQISQCVLNMIQYYFYYTNFIFYKTDTSNEMTTRFSVAKRCWKYCPSSQFERMGGI